MVSDDVRKVSDGVRSMSDGVRSMSDGVRWASDCVKGIRWLKINFCVHLTSILSIVAYVKKIFDIIFTVFLSS